MHQTDPLRPKTPAGLTALLWQNKPICPLPSITIHWWNTTINIAVHPLIDQVTARTFYFAVATPEDLTAWLTN